MKAHECAIFGPFSRGQYRIVHESEVQLKSLPPKVPNLLGRQRDTFKMIQKILEPNSSRLQTLMGMPGVGKSSLMMNTLHFIADRELLKGGSIFINARNITVCEVFLREFVNHLIQENSILFGHVKDQTKHKN